MPLRLCVRQVELARTPCRTRLPFRFGAVTVTSAELATCRVRCTDEAGATVHGWSADLLVPRWFRKDTAATPREDADELHASAVAAAAAFVERSRTARTPFALWRDVFEQRVGSQPVAAPDLLVRGFGTALLERAVLDAACRAAAQPFAAALRGDAFGFRPGAVHGELADWQWQDALPEPRSRLAVRHTVGMLDVLRTADLDPARRVDDGLPQTLEQDVEAYGLRWFKVKIGAGVAADRARLLDLAAFFAERDLAPRLTLDGNEQFEDTAQLAELLETVAVEPAGRELLRTVAWIEQPLSRAATFDAARHRDLARVSAFAPLILDEADALPGSFPRALAIGYRGVSVKNCKGVFRALCNFGLCRRGEGRFQAGEDLTNVAVLPLQQDLVTAAVLGLPHVERNGHHYFRGLDHLPKALAAQAAQAHGDLYRGLDGGTALRVSGGEVTFGSALQAHGYGHALDGHATHLHVVAS
ncbi:MAG TPA: mandelate racemase [Planctomycetota bacterium]|nr:mandelate racemase [Planctomycetota bacterium]